MYRHVEYYPGDPILSLVETFKRDERPEKSQFEHRYLF